MNKNGQNAELALYNCLDTRYSMNCHRVWLRFAAASLLFPTLFSLRLYAQQPQPVPNAVGLPKPAVAPTTGTWKYRETSMVGPSTNAETFSLTIKDDGGVWTVTYAMKSHLGPVTDVSTLEKDTLVLRKESFNHFPGAHLQKPVAINLDFNGNKVTGTIKYVGRPDKPVAVDLDGPVFAYVDFNSTIGCLPLADGYSTAFRVLNIETLAVHPEASNKQMLLQLKVVGRERVTVPAGTFDSYKVELTVADGSYKETVWIATDSRTPVKSSYVEGPISGTIELVP